MPQVLGPIVQLCLAWARSPWSVTGPRGACSISTAIRSNAERIAALVSPRLQPTMMSPSRNPAFSPSACSAKVSTTIPDSSPGHEAVAGEVGACAIPATANSEPTTVPTRIVLESVYMAFSFTTALPLGEISSEIRKRRQTLLEAGKVCGWRLVLSILLTEPDAANWQRLPWHLPREPAQPFRCNFLPCIVPLSSPWVQPSLTYCSTEYRASIPDPLAAVADSPAIDGSSG